MKIYARGTLLFIGILFVILASWAPQSQAAYFSDNFDNQNGGNGALSYTGFANWTISNGTVDLIGNGFFDFLPGHGLYVDLDGSTSNAGLMTSESISLPSAGSYSLVFYLAGNQYAGNQQLYPNTGPETVDVSVLSGSNTLRSQTYVMQPLDPFTRYELQFTIPGPTSIDLLFHDRSQDNIGALLDNVSVNSVPIPPSAFLLGSGLLGLGLLGWRRKRS